MVSATRGEAMARLGMTGGGGLMGRGGPCPSSAHLPAAMLDGVIFAGDGSRGVAPGGDAVRLAARLSALGLRTAAMVPSNPAAADQVTRLHTTLSYRGHRLRITATHASTTVAASPCDAQPVTIRTGDHVLQISGGQIATLDATSDGYRLRMVDPEPAPALPA